ncbi:C40 family peptidase [uncultured Jatrophihabitans sp.]|uniref:C40 family peptidase n=1 Tax=uncultured Jatrophihabitans sp. TaxID=1610747 RepID=UPI0035CBE9E9
MLAIAGLGATLLVAPNLAAATPAGPHAGPHAAPAPKPDIASVQKQLGRLAVTNSQLVDQYDTAVVTLGKAQKAAAAAQAAARAAAASYNAASSAFTRTVQVQYESGGITSGAALLSSHSGSNYLDRLDALRLLSNHDSSVVDRVSAARAVAASKASAANTAVAKARASKTRLAARKSTVTTQIGKYRTLLATLNSAQRAAYQRAANPSVKKSSSKIQNIPVSGTTAGARRAVQYALNQVGKPYVFGADGPSSFDCSGLTMKAWQAGGVSLPHSAAGQYSYGHHVSRDALQPGDLIFFYQPIGHVTIYIGNGYMVSAPTEGENVSVVPLSAFDSDYTGATRLT